MIYNVRERLILCCLEILGCSIDFRDLGFQVVDKRLEEGDGGERREKGVERGRRGRGEEGRRRVERAQSDT